MTRYRWVAARRAEGFPTTMACRIADVSTSAFYDWCQREAAGPTEAQQVEEALVAEIRAIHTEFDGTYGEPRVTPELRGRGYCVNHKRVERLMREHGIVGVYTPPRLRTTIPASNPVSVPDLIERRFAPGAPNVTYVGDITYIGTGEGWLYLASVLDLGSRLLAGYSMADHMRTELVADALAMAVATRGGLVAGAIFHSDRGSQYLAHEYQELLARHDVRQSVGRVGTCFDNSVAEAFWASLKRELVHRYRFATRAEARRAIFAWINRYNHRRLHSSLDYLPPTAWEARYHQTKATRAA